MSAFPPFGRLLVRAWPGLLLVAGAASCAVAGLPPPGATSNDGGAASSSSGGSGGIGGSGGGSSSGGGLTGTTVTGEVVDPAVSSRAKAALDGTPGGGGAPQIVYPLDGALFPSHFAPVAFQVVPNASGSYVGRVAFEGDLIDVKVYTSCQPIPQPTVAGGCVLDLSPAAGLEAALVSASEGDHMTETVRLVASDGSGLVESKSVDVRWAADQLHGALYYWSAQTFSQGGKNELRRYDLDSPGNPPIVYYTDTDTLRLEPSTSSAVPSPPCFGCHAISLDGTKIGLTYGGSVQSGFGLLDVAKVAPIAKRILTGDAQGFVSNAGFATETAFSPDGTTLVQSFRGNLWVRAADATLAMAAGQPLFATGTPPSPALAGAAGELVTQPYWSPKGDLLVFTSWAPMAGGSPGTSVQTGDEIPGAQIWSAPVSGTGASATFGTPALLVPRVAGKTEYYPATSDDSKFVVFNESSCNGPPSNMADGWGLGACDSYDDPSARLRLVATSNGTIVDLVHASGTDTWTDSWPRFGPPLNGMTGSHATFRGKTLYWIAFSSRRPYGATVAGSNMGLSTPQLWFAAITIGTTTCPTTTELGKPPCTMPDPLSTDPSFSPVWLPLQNDAHGSVGGARGNHLPQWVVKAIPIEIPR